MSENRPPLVYGTAPAQEGDGVARTIQAVVNSLIAGASDAEELLARLQPPKHLTPVGRALTAKEQWRVFRRDGFTCRYCSKQTIFIPLLRVLSHLYPEKLPFHPHWRWEATHPVYWTYGSSCDHLVPVSRGGGSSADNLLTACYQCNSIKQHWLVEELRWSVLPTPVAPEWDGLSGSYLDLCELTRATGDRYHAAWVRVVGDATRDYRFAIPQTPHRSD